jgi:hypothetical protein
MTRNNQLGAALAAFVDTRSAPNIKPKVGILGDADGVIDVSGRDGFVYVQLSTPSDLMQVLNAGRIDTSSAMAGVRVIIGYDSVIGMWRVMDLMRDTIGASTGLNIATTDQNGSPQTVSVNNYQHGSPVGQAGSLTMLNSSGAATTTITNVTYNTTSETLYAQTSNFITQATLQKNVIGSGDTVDIDADYYWIVARNLTNGGTLINDGDLVVIG